MRLISRTAFVLALATSTSLFAQQQQGRFGAEALAATAKPIHPGVPGQTPFWNKYSWQFIWAPAFDFKDIAGAAKYRFEIAPEGGGAPLTFVADHPWSPLSPVWTKVPVGYFTVTVKGLDGSGKVVGEPITAKHYRAQWFNGPYNVPPVMDYSQSASVALDHLLSQKFVQYWFDHKAPDPSYGLYRYPAKIWGALVVGAVTQAKLKAGTPEAEHMTQLARIIADKLLEVSFKPGTPLEYITPTYQRAGYESYFKGGKINTDSDLTISAIDGGIAFLEIYDLTHDPKYLKQAEGIARTLVKTQLPSGTWYTFMYPATGKPTYPNLAIPTAILNYYDRLMEQYHVTGLKQSRDRTLQWLMDNPVKTFDWQAQFEDTGVHAPYRNQSREQACDLAVYLLNHRKDNPKYEPLAEELIRYAEDQFVVWEIPKIPHVLQGKRVAEPDSVTANWITPTAQEQFTFWMPVSRTAAIMMNTYQVAYETTHKPIYLAKARSFANTFTKVQKAHNGEYPTMFTAEKSNFWLNNLIYPARFMMIFDNSTKAGKK